MNKITLIGNLTKDPEVRSTTNGHSVCQFSIAVNRKKVSGDPVTDFFRINAWGALGEVCNKYLAKGRKVAVFGELQANLYKSKSGDNKMALDVQAEEIEFLSPKEKEGKETKEQFSDLPDSDGLPF